MTETKTIREWLNELPKPYRSRAIRNTEELVTLGYKRDSLIDALASSFVWIASPEGKDFWYSVARGETPELPEHLNEEK